MRGDLGKSHSILFCLQAVAAKGLKANEWVTHVLTVLGGKGGGRELVAQGTGTQDDKVDEALKLAQDFAKLKLGL